jgi:MFS family permease
MPQGRDVLALWINERVFYGWLMLVVAAIGMFASGPGQSHLFSVFIPPISEDLGISRTSISSAYGLATLVAAFGLPYMGRLVDRHGVRSVLIVVALLLGFSALAFGTVANLALLALGFGALRFFGQGSLMLSCANLVAQWFDRKRGFALSLMALGFSASVAVHPPLAQWLIDHVGWRQAWLWLGLITWLLLVPVVVLLVQDKPEDLGLKPDGASRRVPSGSVPSQSDAAGTPESAADSADAGLAVRQAIRTPAFWIIALSLATFSMLATGLFFHQASIFASLGLSPQVAARVFPVSAITMVLAMPVVGRMLDRLPTRPTFAAAMLSMSAGTVSLLAARDVRTALLYAVVFGISNAAINAHLSYLWPRFFGRRHLGSIQGLAQTIAVIGASIGPIPLAFAFDQFGDYQGALITLSLLPVLCAIAILFMQPPRLEDDAACKAA